MMRVEAGARAVGPDGAGACAGRFDEALARAGRTGRDREEAPGVRAGRDRDEGPAARTGRGRNNEGARAAARPRDVRKAGGPAPRPEGIGAPAAGLAAPAPDRALALAEVAPVPELAAAVRVLPVAVAALRSPAGAPLTLSFGRSLEVELRATPAGVDLVLRPAPGLARAAEAELPRLVAALRVRGVTVAHAEVRSRGQRGGRAR